MTNETVDMKWSFRIHDNEEEEKYNQEKTTQMKCDYSSGTATSLRWNLCSLSKNSLYLATKSLMAFVPCTAQLISNAILPFSANDRPIRILDFSDDHNGFVAPNMVHAAFYCIVPAIYASNQSIRIKSTTLLLLMLLMMINSRLEHFDFSWEERAREIGMRLGAFKCPFLLFI